MCGKEVDWGRSYGKVCPKCYQFQIDRANSTTIYKHEKEIRIGDINE
jgi:hypothetical protein